jgi:hypothetical protein
MFVRTDKARGALERTHRQLASQGFNKHFFGYSDAPRTEWNSIQWRFMVLPNVERSRAGPKATENAQGGLPASAATVRSAFDTRPTSSPYKHQQLRSGADPPVLWISIQTRSMALSISLL